ncbi:hypothetical protein CKO11_15600 [Rhodobacter sp. TJ_12]|nr:hypothetical protein [Rhodobacter sp. TJ_12]
MLPGLAARLCDGITNFAPGYTALTGAISPLAVGAGGMALGALAQEVVDRPRGLRLGVPFSPDLAPHSKGHIHD